jgi:ATP-dependent RNA helicase DeaD
MSIIDLISLINKETGDQSIEIGKIEVLKNFSFFEIESSRETEILHAFKNVERDGTKVKVEISNSKGESDKNERKSFGGKSWGQKSKFEGKRKDSYKSGGKKRKPRRKNKTRFNKQSN